MKLIGSLSSISVPNLEDASGANKFCIEPSQLDGNESHVASGGSVVRNLPTSKQGALKLLRFGVKFHVKYMGLIRRGG